MPASLRILANFHVFVSQGRYDSGPHEGEDKPARRVDFVRGQSVPVADLPPDQSADDWKAKGLAEDITDSD